MPEQRDGFDLFSAVKDQMRRLVDFTRALFAAIDSEAAAERSLHPGYDRRASQILLVAAVVLTLAYFFCKPSFFLSMFGTAVARSVPLNRYRELISHSYWCLGKSLLLAVVPLVHLRLSGERPADYGLVRGFAAAPSGPGATANPSPRVSLRIYLALMLVILPVIVLASFTPTFQQTYPLYWLAGRSLFELLVWETEYAFQFFAIEFFFRGYLVFGLRRAFGSQSIFIAMVPYCMFHFTKPPAEALGAILAGLVLGSLALGSRTIWGGVLLHVSVALTMDFSALVQKHALPSLKGVLPL